MSQKLLVSGIAGAAVVGLAVLVASTSHDPVSPAPPGARSASPRASAPPRLPVASASPARSAAPPPAPLPLEIHVPRATSPIVADGEVEDAAWAGRLGRTGAFRGPDGADARPYSDARFLWSDGKLHVVLYAADEDIRTLKVGAASGQEDSFHMVFDDGKLARSLDVSPLGVLTEGSRPSGSPASAPPAPWKSGAKLGHDLDGTPDDPKDQDEEWVIEMDVPLASLGLEGRPGERIGLSIERCDTPKKSARTCAGWGSPRPGTLVLE